MESTSQQSVQKAKLGDIRKLITSMVMANQGELRKRVASEAVSGVRIANPTVFKSMVYGSAGLGKSTMYAGIAKDTNMCLATISMATQDIVSIQGIPMPNKDNGTMEFFATQQLPRGIPPSLGGKAWDGEYGILVLDEITSAPSRNVQNMVMRLVLDGTMEDYILPPGWVICMAGNLGSDDGSEAEDLVTPLLDRIDLKFRVLPDAQSWLEYGSGYEANGRPVIHPVISAHINANTAKLSTLEDQLKKYDGAPIGFVTPRSWKALSDNLYSYSDNKDDKGVREPNKINLTHELKLLIKGQIGPDAGNELIDFIGILSKIPFSVEQLLSGEKVKGLEGLDRNAKIYMYLSAVRKVYNELKIDESVSEGSGEFKFNSYTKVLFDRLSEEEDEETMSAVIGHYADSFKVGYTSYLAKQLRNVTAEESSHPRIKKHMIRLSKQLSR
jgi:hypothetical protein